MSRGLAFSIVAGLALAACPAAPPPSPPPVAPPAPEPKTALPAPREDGRLPALAKPLAYRLSLTIDPRAPRFSGRTEIDVEVPAATSYVVLHGHALAIGAASATVAGRAPIAAKAAARPAHGHKGAWPEELVLAFEHPLPPGRATLVLAYDAPFDDELSGVYRVSDDGRWYAFSQFEATDARRAFPCFDEPGYKTPFDVTIHAPTGMIAVANAPETRREADDRGTAFHFATTKPLPTYLVALAVGELDVRDAPRREGQPPIRIVTTKGKTAMGDLALEATGAIVDALGRWFGIPYPYEKLDVVAVPDFSAGAMENAGLVTFREELLLLDPARASVRARRAQALVVAHELAHQWFGDLVTAAWWDDLWLNEGMAEWMESRIVDQWRPAWGTRIDAVVAETSVMDTDALATARAVRQPVTTTGEANEAFDGITYQKGAAVLSTIENWIGPDAFRRGVQAYLSSNAFTSVHADKLLSSLDTASGKDVTQMAGLFLDKPGVPVVLVQMSCARGRWNAELTQEAWRPLGSKVPEDQDRTWMLPICAAVPGEKKPLCADLAFGAPSLVAGRGCPSWIHPNAFASYYRFVLPEPKALEAASAKLDVVERVTLVSNAWAAVRAGKSKPESMLKLVAAFDDDPARQVVDEVATILHGMSDVLVEDEARPAFQKLVAARFAKRKKALGWQPTGANAEAAGGDQAYLRRTVLYAMGDLAEDETTLKEADEVARKWLADPKSVDADAAAVALDLASRRAGEARVAELLAAAKAAKTREDRVVALRALAGFDAPEALQKALDATLGDEIHLHEVRYVLPAALARRKSRNVAEAWLRAHWDALRKKMPGSQATMLVRGAAVGCSKEEAEERAAYYGPRLADVEGAARPLAESLENVSLCAELRRFGASALTRALVPKKR